MDREVTWAFQTMWQRLLEQERALRAADRALLGQYRRLVVTLARRVAPAALDAALRRDPRFVERATPEEWEALFRVANERAQHTGWEKPDVVAPTEIVSNSGASRLPSASLSTRTTEPVWQERPVERPREPKGETVVEQASEPASRAGDGRGVEAKQKAPGSGPSRAPNSLAELLTDAGVPRRFPGDLPEITPASWVGDMAYLIVLARTGWVAHRSIVGEMNRLQGKDPRRKTGTDDRRQQRLERAGLLQGETLDTPAGRLRISRLTEAGQAYLARFGIQAVEDELTRLHRAHGGQRQAPHAALVCFTAYLARLYGYRTQVCPQVDGPAEPDLLLERAEERIYLEVEAGSGEPERRMRKWRNLARLQGFVALVAPTEARLLSLMAEARAAGCRGRGTSLDFVKGMRQDFWSHRW